MTLVERGIPCDCGLVECEPCSGAALRDGARASTNVTILERWGDVARCRVEVCFEVSQQRWVEAYAKIEPGPVFAVVAGSLASGDESLAAELMSGEAGRRAYLHARRNSRADPMLALRRGPGRIDVRVFPVRLGQSATVVLEGYVLFESKRQEPVRLYRTGDRYLAVTHDWQGVRSLDFLSKTECRERFPDRAAEDVPFVKALESALTSRGRGAACDDVALAALPPGSPQPPFVGPDRYVEYRLRPAPDPSDPEPPPPLTSG